MFAYPPRVRALVTRLICRLPAAIQNSAEPCAQSCFPPQSPVVLPFRQAHRMAHRAVLNPPLTGSAANHFLREMHQTTARQQERTASHPLQSDGSVSEVVESYDETAGSGARSETVVTAGAITIPDDMPQVDPQTEDGDEAEEEISIISMDKTMDDLIKKKRERRRRPFVKPEIPSPTRENIELAISAIVDIEKLSDDPVSQLEHLCNKFSRQLVVNYNISALRPKYVIEASLECLSEHEPKVVLESGIGESHSKKAARQSAAVALIQKISPKEEVSNEETTVLQVEEQETGA